MNHLKDKSMTYTLVHGGKEFCFQIDRKGKGLRICSGQMWEQIRKEDPHLMIRGKLLADKQAMKRIAYLEREFSLSVTVPRRVTEMMWQGWHKAGEASNKTRTFEGEIDRLLGEVIDR